MSLKNGSRYLVFVFGLIALMGLELALTPFLTDLFGTLYYDSYVGAGSYAGLSDAARDYQLFLHGILGAVMAGWCVMLMYIAAVPLRKGERWAWNLILVSLLVWFVPDTYISGFTGNWMNVGVNVVTVLLVDIGLWMTYRHVKQASVTTGQALTASS